MDIAVLGLEDRRIFVSYSRQDGALTAERLAGILTTLRFDVFLDRFRIPPGSDLLERISDELVDKAMVVVVETPQSIDSQWVRYEVSTATSRRLGLVAVNFVNVPGLPGIDETARCRTDDPAVLVKFLLEQHRRQMSERRQNLLQSVWRSLSREVGPSYISPMADGFRVQKPSSPGYAITVHTRPAQLHHFRLAYERAGIASAVVIHPQPQRVDRRRDLAWLSQQTGIGEVDEGLIDQAAQQIGLGLL
jgi:hypothetical protein